MNDIQKKSGLQADNPDLSEILKIANRDGAFVKKMIRTFIALSEEVLNKMNENLASKNMVNVGNHAHRLIAPAKHFKLEQIVTTLINIEQLTKNNGNEADIQIYVQQLGSQVNLTNDKLNRLLVSI